MRRKKRQCINVEIRKGKRKWMKGKEDNIRVRKRDIKGEKEDRVNRRRYWRWEKLWILEN